MGSASRAVAMAPSSSAQSSTRLTPRLDPARAGLTNTGSPSRSFSSTVRVDLPLRSTTQVPTGSPSAASSFLVNSLSMPAALASTPAPT